MSEKATKFVFINSALQLGGIENWIIKQIRVAVKHGIEVIWLQNGEGEVFDGWKDLVKKNVTVVKFDRKTRMSVSFDKTLFSKEDRITAVSFGLVDYYHLLLFRQALPEAEVKCFYMIPHFQNARYYPEDEFSDNRIENVIIKLFTKQLYCFCDQNKALLYFSKRHADGIENRYGLTLNRVQDRVNKNIELNNEFDYELAESRSKRSPFTIITCGRFEFPHKGYILGLIDLFADLKKDYPNMRLIIIGYGAGETVLKNKVGSLPETIQKDIIFTGAVAPEKLHEYFDQAHVNISVAGGVAAGAKTGLVSIPARHYSYTCEVYGYLPGSKGCTLMDKPGEDARKYIIDLVEMDMEQYQKLCYDSFCTYAITDANLLDECWLYSIKNEKIYDKKFVRKYVLFEVIDHFFYRWDTLKAFNIKKINT